MSKEATEFELDIMMNKAQINSILSYYKKLSEKVEMLYEKYRDLGFSNTAGLLTAQEELNRHSIILNKAKEDNAKGIIVNIYDMLEEIGKSELRKTLIKDEVSKLNEFIDKRFNEAV